MQRPFLSLVAAVGLFILIAAPSAAITGGQPDGDGHPYVGIVFNNEAFCSGTLIAPTIFLTAGHCTSLFAETFGPDDPVVLSFDPDIFGAMNFVVASAVVTHPDFCIACAPGLPGFDMHDVDLVLLNDPITGIGFGALPESGLLDQLPLKQETFTAVGYGVQEFAVGGGPPEPSAFGSRFYASLQPIGITDRVGDMFLKALENKGGTCFGDSGGPIFLDDQVTIAAITSYGTNQVCAGVGYHQRLDRDDILSFIYGYL